MTEPLNSSEEHWRAALSPEQFAVCRQGATERPFSGLYYHCDEPGSYHCACCDGPLFCSAAKYDSGSGWPSFFEPLSAHCISEHLDASHGMRRVEIRCAQCAAHLGHVFEDGPAPSGLRYCVNSLSLQLHPLTTQKGAGDE